MSPFGNTSPSSPSRSILGYYWVATNGVTFDVGTPSRRYPTAAERSAAAASFATANFFGTNLPYYVTTNPSAAISGVNQVQNRTTGDGFIWGGSAWTNIGNQGNLPPATFTQNATYFDTRTRRLLLWAHVSTTVGQLNLATVTGIYITVNISSQQGHQTLDGDILPTSNDQGLRTGDWIVITNISGNGTEATPFVITMATVDNAYEIAGTQTAGIVKVSGQTNVGAWNATTNPNGLRQDYSIAITENDLLNLMGSGENKIAFGNHVHGSITTDGKVATATAASSGQHLVITSSSDVIQQSAIELGSTTTTFLNNAGAWATPAGTYAHPTQLAINVNATDNGVNVIDSVVVDTLGHVTSVGTRNLSNATTSAAGAMSSADKTKLDGIATGATANAGTVTSVSGTANVVSVTNGTTAAVINLVAGHAGTINPYASQTAKFVLAAPNANDGSPSFRALVASDIPTLNQNTTGTAANVTGTVAVANGGTGQTSYTDGQLLIGNSTGNTLTKATLTAGTSITVTNGAGAITIANSAPNATHTGDVTGSGALTIATNAVTFAKFQQIATSRIVGRVSANTGNTEELTPANVRTIIELGAPIYIQTATPVPTVSNSLWYDIN
jgi:hypothetical protein